MTMTRREEEEIEKIVDRQFALGKDIVTKTVLDLATKQREDPTAFLCAVISTSVSALYSCYENPIEAHELVDLAIQDGEEDATGIKPKIQNFRKLIEGLKKGEAKP